MRLAKFVALKSAYVTLSTQVNVPKERFIPKRV